VLKIATDPANQTGQGSDSSAADQQIDFFIRQQDHSPAVAVAYRACARSDRRSFLDGVAGAASRVQHGVGYSWPGIRANLDWQWKHNQQSIDAAQREYGVGGPAPSARLMYFTLYGQRHSPGVMQAYRAAFRDNPAQFIEIVNSYR
jgi:hypothetical protein